jgi:hypothetical protein
MMLVTLAKARRSYRGHSWLFCSSSSATPRCAGWLAAESWPGAVAGGWNAQDTQVGGSLRIPLGDLPAGAALDDPQTPRTDELAKRRAIVVIPDQASLTSGKVEVLLHFHGWNIGVPPESAAAAAEARRRDRPRH